MHPISLHQLIAPEISNLELLRLAQRLQCAHVCLFTQAPVPAWERPLVTDADIPDLRGAMQDCGISAYGITSFAVEANVDPALQEAGLERGAHLGAKYASVRIADPDQSRAADAFARLCALAAGYGIVCSIEFVGFNRPELLPWTLDIIEQAGAGALSIDPLHLVRSGASLDVLRALDRSKIGYVQLCDGPEAVSEEIYQHETRFERLPPGEGSFPLPAFLAVVPPGRPVSLEVPQDSLRDRSAEHRARRAVDAARRVLSKAARNDEGRGQAL